MIVSHAHRFIFLKTKKTGGTSMELALRQICGDDDIITPVSPEDEVLGASLGARGPQNCTLSETALVNHMTAQEVKSLLPSHIWDNYYKFTIERNPFDKAISLYYWTYRKKDIRPQMQDFLANCSQDRISNWNIYTIEGIVAVDAIIRYEHLPVDLKSVEKAIGQKIPELPNAKSTQRLDRRHYQDVLSEEDISIIRRKCANEIACFRWDE